MRIDIVVAYDDHNSVMMTLMMMIMSYVSTTVSDGDGVSDSEVDDDEC